MKDIAEGNQQTLNNTHCLASYLQMLLVSLKFACISTLNKKKGNDKKGRSTFKLHIYANKVVTKKGFPEELLFMSQNDEYNRFV